MSYCLRPGQPIDDEVRRILLEQNRRALSLLRNWTKNPRDRVHQARQAFKRIRALLRLVRSGARYVYRVENVFYRDLGRQLAYARDTEAVIDALRLLEPRVAGPRAQDTLHDLRARLEQRAARERDCGHHDLPGRIEAVCEELKGAEKRLRDLPLDTLRRKDLRYGVAVGLERCAGGFRGVARRQTAEDLHAWRKEVKYAHHQTRLMQLLASRRAAASGSELGALAEVLGHYHDLYVLSALLRNPAERFGDEVHLRSMGRAVRSAMASLSSEALARGGRLFPVAGAATADAIDLSTGA